MFFRSPCLICCALVPLVCGPLLVGDWLPCCTYRYEREILNCSGPEVPLTPADDANDLGMVHVAYSSDGKNFVGVLGSMLSLSEHLKEPSNCTIHLVVEAADFEKAEQLLRCFRNALPVGRAAGPHVELHRLAPMDLEGLDTPYRRHLVRPQTFARLHLHEYLPRSARRVLWLDHDTIVRSDVRPLYQMRMRHAIAVTWEQGNGDTMGGTKVRQYAPFLPSTVMARLPDLNARLFSTAVMLMDLDQWRAGNITPAVMEWVRIVQGTEGEQLAMNLHFGNRTDILPWSWNVMGLGWVRYRLPQHCLDKASVLHWAGPNRHKPWSRHWSRIEVHNDLFAPYDLREQCQAIA